MIITFFYSKTIYIFAIQLVLTKNLKRTHFDDLVKEKVYDQGGKFEAIFTTDASHEGYMRRMKEKQFDL